MEGRLRLAEKERARVKAKAPGGVPAATAAGPSDEQLAAMEAAADANMAALLQEEEVQKARALVPPLFQLSPWRQIAVPRLWRALSTPAVTAHCHCGVSHTPALALRSRVPGRAGKGPAGTVLRCGSQGCGAGGAAVQLPQRCLHLLRLQ